jgi:flagellar biosynthetic protein FliR
MIISLGQLEVFFLILARVAGVFIMAPLFSTRSFAASGKIALAVWIAMVLWFVTPVVPNLPTGMLSFFTALAVEVAVGFTIGFICNILFTALQSAGEIIDLQMGLSVAQALDPVFGSVISIVGRMIFFVTLTIFITVNGHHMILSAFHQSFSALPAGKLPNFTSPDLVVQMMGLGQALWMTAIKLAAPVVLLIFLADFTFGIVSRVAPQVNVFMLGFQVKPFIGLFGVLLISPFLVKYVGKVIESFGEEIIRFLMAIK